MQTRQFSRPQELPNRPYSDIHTNEESYLADRPLHYNTQASWARKYFSTHSCKSSTRHPFTDRSNYEHLSNMRSKDNAVGTVTRLWSGQKESCGSIPRKRNKLISSRELQDRLCSLSGPVFNGYRKHGGRGESSHSIHFCRGYE